MKIELSVKWDSLETDFIMQSLTTPWFDGVHDSNAYFDLLDTMQDGEPSPPMDFDFAGRDGMFDKDQLFAVWERRDVEALIKVLQGTLT